MSKLKLEVGKTYITRNGNAVSIVEHQLGNGWPYFDENGDNYLSSGLLYHDSVCDGDIVREATLSDLTDRWADAVNSPKHYTSHPSGIECIEITGHMGFCLGNAMKYIWRADLKHDAIEDLRKAIWYINHEISKREAS